MTIIIEGADLVGKTTLQKKIIAKLRERGINYPSVHLSCLADGEPEPYLDMLCTRQVWDRFHMSEIVYRCEDEKLTTMSPIQYTAIDSYLKQLPSYTIVLTASALLLRERYAERGDQLYDLQSILQLNSHYERIVRDRGLEMRGDWYDVHLDYNFHSNLLVNGKPSDELIESWVSEYLGRLSCVRPRLAFLETPASLSEPDRT